MLDELIFKLKNKEDLTYDEITYSMENILSGKISDQDTAIFLKNLRDKGESDVELLGMLDKMQSFSIQISPKHKSTIIDVCGTGGDNLQTFNISTTAAFVIAAAGGAVAKHGNRSVSGVSGSADIFEYFGYDLNAPPQRVTEIIEKFGIGFMFAQKFHPAMKNVAKARKMIGGRTAFNLLGPLSNPAQVKNQLIGVFSDTFLQRLILLLKKRGAQNIMTVISENGLDELSTLSKNKICFLKNGEINSIIFDPQKLGLKKGNLNEIQISSKEEAVNAFVSVLNNTANNSMIEITALNAAAGLIVANVADDFKDAIEISLDTIKSGATYSLFEDFIRFCGDVKKLEELEK